MRKILIFFLAYLFHNASATDYPLSTIADCHFLNSQCWWVSATKWDLKTTYANRYRSVQFDGPSRGPFPNGHYIQLYNGENSLSNIELKTTYTMLAKTTTDCLTFYHYLHGSDSLQNYAIPQIQLRLTPTAGSVQTLWTRRYSSGDQWHKNNVNIGPQTKPYILSFMASPLEGAVGLANITVSPGSCQLINQTDICDFESGACNWTANALGGGNYNFKLLQANSSTSSSEYDHTTESQYGHYMEASGGTSSSDATELVSPKFGGSGKYCLRFWYWRHDHQYNTIKAYIRTDQTGYDNKVWESDFNYPKSIWHRAQADVQLNRGHALVIQASHLSSADNSSAVDIDDISITPQSCTPPIDCDFNIDLCGWTREVNDEKWNHGIGRVIHKDKLKITETVYAPVDMTTPNDGMFIYSDFTQMSYSSSSTMQLKSEFVAATKSSCFTFLYFILNFPDSNAKFQVILHDNTGSVISTPWTFDPKTDATLKQQLSNRQWMQQRVDINSNGKMFRIVLQISTISAATYVAVDNVKYNDGYCDGISTATTISPTPPPVSPTIVTTEQPMFNCINTKQSIPRTKVCDGVKDCDDGSDEADCGSCDFSQDMCGYTNTTKIETNDPLSYWWRNGNITSGPKVGPNGQTHFIIAQAYRDTNWIEVATLFSPYIDGSAAGCSLHFYYNIYGHMSEAKRWSRLVVNINLDNYRTIEIWNSDALIADKFSYGWGFASAIIGRIEGRFRITFEAMDYSEHHSTAYVALANIKMDSCRTDVNEYCTDTSFQCANGHCVSPEYVCDGADDCGDGSDESANACQDIKARCDFEYGMCEWTSYGQDTWEISTGTSNLQDGATRDHTKGINSGHFLSLFSNKNDEVNGTVRGHVFEDNKDDEDQDVDDDNDTSDDIPCKMRFWLSIEGNYTTPGLLEIHLQDTKTGYLNRVWSAPPSYFPLYVFGYSRIITTHLTNNGRPFRVAIQGSVPPHRDSPTKNYIAIDDISFSSSCQLSTENPIMTTIQHTTIPNTMTPNITTPSTTTETTKSMFKCHSSDQLIPRTKVCDGIKDCPDGSDESDCVSFELERQMCSMLDVLINNIANLTSLMCHEQKQKLIAMLIKDVDNLFD